jgi:protein subunit release factor A
MDPNFPKQIYDDVKKLFPVGAIETLVSRAPGPDGPANSDSAVCVVHTPTGLEIVCDDFPSQIENFIAAAIRLRIACDAPG